MENNNAIKNSTNFKLNMRIVLAALWVARMLSGIQGDTVRLSDQERLQSILAGTGPVIVTKDLLLIMSIIFVVPIFMSVLSLMLKYPVVRWANRIMGIFFAAFDLVFFILALFVWRAAGYEIVWSIAYLVFTIQIAWFAWKLPKQEM